MSSNIGILVFVVLAAIAVGVKGSQRYDPKEGAQTMTRGTRKMVQNKAVDLLLYHESIRVDGTIFPFPMVHSQDICYPPKKRNNQAKFTITALNLEDISGKGGLAYMKKDGGGVGKHKVCFHLQSLRGHTYHFNVDVWGYYD